MAPIPPPPRQLRGETSPAIPATRELLPHEKDRESDRARSDRLSRVDVDRGERERDVRPDRPTRYERDRDERERFDKRDRVGKDDREWKPSREAMANESVPRPSQSGGLQSPSTSSLAERISGAPSGPAAANRFEGNPVRDEPSERLKRTAPERDKLDEPPMSGGAKGPNKKTRIDRSRLNFVQRQMGGQERRR